MVAGDGYYRGGVQTDAFDLYEQIFEPLVGEPHFAVVKASEVLDLDSGHLRRQLAQSVNRLAAFQSSPCILDETLLRMRQVIEMRVEEVNEPGQNKGRKRMALIGGAGFYAFWWIWPGLFGHAAAIGVSSLYVFLWERWIDHERLRSWSILGLVAGLVAIVRWQNALLPLVSLFWLAPSGGPAPRGGSASDRASRWPPWGSLRSYSRRSWPSCTARHDGQRNVPQGTFERKQRTLRYRMYVPYESLRPGINRIDFS